MISNLGFNLIKPTIKADGLSPDGNLIYSRPGQKVKREITIWKPKN